ncbi:MAG TPA: Xaa-Pro peptidase family protein, partial [Gemmatimonadales bacterium]|nr:Xaa-Pro peptidase family protein [Gemmatimonadales bacterium]
MADPRPARRERLVAALASAGIDVLLVTHIPNIRWLTGFTGSAGVLLATAERLTMVTDFRYATQAPAEVGNAADVVIELNSVWTRIRGLLDRLGGRLGYESHILPVRDADRIVGRAGEAVGTVELVESLRESKDAGEVESIRLAGVLALDALGAVLPTIRAGERELDVAARLEFELRRRGSERHPFETILASGPRSALPHARTSTRVIESGEFLLIDFGATVDGYCSDVTRTVVIGRADSRQRSIYQLVREAHDQAVTGLRAGMIGRDGDALALEQGAQAGADQ